MAQLRAGDPGGLFVVAGSQDVGRGRGGRRWSSPPGNLYCSLALRDPAPPALAPQLGFVTSVALAGVLRARLGGDLRLRLKWPNDVLHDEAKLAGILLESTALPDGHFGCVIGIGVNCVSHPDGLEYPATDLCAAGDPAPRPDALLGELAVGLDRQIRLWRGGAGFAAVRAEWIAMAAGLGAPIRVRTPRREMHGTFRDLDRDGRLLLESAGELVPIEAGDVFLSKNLGER